ncbi:MAG: aminotransferase class III-fold pyridoxal phosphate-dependent enzyme, partial [Tenuifilaceae bacterium]|nr:aminotransferase class III-fold pyridoxal phosphate-dependent enzyme [Tenuifilaceae bacterium]
MVTHRELFLKHIAQTSDAPLTLEVAKAEGVYLYTPEGKRICDLISGVSVSNVGHSHPAVVSAISEQAAKYMHLMVYGELVQAPQVKLAHAIVNLLPPNFESVYFVNSGSEAVEGGVKLAKRYTGRPEVVSM